MMLLLVGVLLVGSAPGVAHAFQRAFVAASPEGAVVTGGATGSVAIELGDGAGAALTVPIAGLRPDDEVPDDEQPTDAFAEREFTVGNTAADPSSIHLTVAYAPGARALEGLRVSVSRIAVDEVVVVPDADVPTAAPVGEVPAGDEVTFQLRFRLAHDAPASVIGQDSVVRVTVDAQSRAGGNR